MKCLPLLLAAALLAPGLPLRAADEYPLTADSQPQPNVPKGEVLKFTFDKSTIFPGTTRTYSVYVPKQYDPAKPACLYVNQDGVQYQAPTVFDNLIAKGEMPVTIGVFITPGKVPAPGPAALDRFNRSLEYDGLGPDYVNFLEKELLPEVLTKTATDGRPIRFSASGNDHAIAGSSSGGIAAFTAAWERPDLFSRVFTSVGTYVGLRGGNEYPTLIRKYEPKPLRVFLQDGSNDNNIYGGDWWMANQEMERALTFAGYEVNHVWGEGAHNGKHATAIFPDAMRWLWKDWPKAVTKGKGSSQFQDLFVEGSTWEVVDDKVSEMMAKPADCAKRQSGEEYFAGDGQIRRYTLNQKPASTLAAKVDYLPAALCFSPDQSLLYVADAAGKWVWSYQVSQDGSLQHGQRFYRLHESEIFPAGRVSMAVDAMGRLFVSTALGVQVCDQAGRVNIIVPSPSKEGYIWAVEFRADDLTLLYACDAEHVYRRKLKTPGVLGTTQPVKPAPPKL